MAADFGVALGVGVTRTRGGVVTAGVAVGASEGGAVGSDSAGARLGAGGKAMVEPGVVGGGVERTMAGLGEGAGRLK